MAQSHRAYTGVLHIHTDKSDGGGTLSDVVEAARKTGVDFVVLTDHGTRGYGAENKEGWHEGVLVLAGEEISTPQGHLLAFETREDVGGQTRIDEAVGAVRRQHGQIVSIHHQAPVIGVTSEGLPPPLPLGQADILEIWSFMDEFLARVNPRQMVQAMSRPERLINGPGRKLLWAWDRELERRRFPIIGGLNIHQRKQPLLDWKLMFPYATAFQTIATCIQVPELPTVSLRARDLVWSALREGRSYIVNRAVGNDRPFAFEFRPSHGRVRYAGEDAPYDPKGRFHIQVPQSAEVVLRHNGQPLFWTTVEKVDLPVSGPGSYRLEVYLNRRTWILSNAIRLVDDDLTHPTVSDVT